MEWVNWMTDPNATPHRRDAAFQQVGYQSWDQPYAGGPATHTVSDCGCGGGGMYPGGGGCDGGCSGGSCGDGYGGCSGCYGDGGGDGYGHDGHDCGCEGYGCDGCDPAMDCCNPCGMGYGLAVGVEATYLKPDVDREVAFESIGHYDYEAAPRIWMHWQNPGGGGVRVRYWNLDAERSGSGANDFDDGAFVLSSCDNLEVDAVDLELTRAFCFHDCSFLGSFGVRHGRLSQDATTHITSFDLEGGGGDDASAILLDGVREMEGNGLTMALDMRVPVFHPRFSAICNLRGSVLWGDNDFNTTVRVVEVVPVGAGDLDLNDFDERRFHGSNGRAAWISELQAGGEWNTPIDACYGGGSAFIRLLVEAQWWNLPGVTIHDDFPNAPDQVYDFLGFTAAVGITR